MDPNDPKLKSFIQVARDSHFPIQNLPYGVFVREGEEVPAGAEIVLEGYVNLDELRTEGPFGDHTGFYSLEDLYPVFHLSCITHRKNPIIPSYISQVAPSESSVIKRVAYELPEHSVRHVLLLLLSAQSHGQHVQLPQQQHPARVVGEHEHVRRHECLVCRASGLSAILLPGLTIFAATVAVIPPRSWRGLYSTTSAPTTVPSASCTRVSTSRTDSPPGSRWETPGA